MEFDERRVFIFFILLHHFSVFFSPAIVKSGRFRLQFDLTLQNMSLVFDVQLGKNCKTDKLCGCQDEGISEELKWSPTSQKKIDFVHRVKWSHVKAEYLIMISF